VAEPFLGEIRIFSFNFPPKTWAFCNGGILPINQNQALFSLFGTTYGGNGQTTFALPNLQGRVPIHQGSGHTIGEAAGSTAVTVNIQQMPTHIHAAMAQPEAGTQLAAVNALLAQALNVYRTADSLTTLNPATVSNVGGSQAHTNMEPYLVLNFCVALQGIFPSQN
jgi:microcystin-dependent protein